MNEYDVRRFGIILAIQAEIEGMKAENMQREIIGDSMTYTDKDFYIKAEELRNVSYCHNEQL